MVEEAGVPGENHRPVGSHGQTLSHDVVSNALSHEIMRITFDYHFKGMESWVGANYELYT
jgi:hypothetical protein